VINPQEYFLIFAVVHYDCSRPIQYVTVDIMLHMVHNVYLDNVCDYQYLRIGIITIPKIILQQILK
jgi:hypothetical protein